MNNMKESKSVEQQHNIDLCNQYYKENLDLRDMLRHKILTASFCKQIILDKDDTYAIGHEDTYITTEKVLQMQPHITLQDLRGPTIKKITNIM